MKNPVSYLFLTLMLSVSWRSWGQEDTNSVVLTKYTQNDGLASYYVTKIVQDTYGFFWIGTQEGLSVFDGVRFQTFSSRSDKDHRLGGSFVGDMVEDKKRGLMWVLTTIGDVCAIDLNTRKIKKRITVDIHNKPLSEKWIRCLYLQGDTLWMGGLDMISAYSILENRYLDLNIGDRSNIVAGEYNISKILFDDQDRMWLGSEGYGLIVLDKNLNHLTTFREELRNNRHQTTKLFFWDMIARRQVLYVATSWGLRAFTLNEKTIHPLTENLHQTAAASEILSMAFAGPNLLLFTTPGNFYTYDLAREKIQKFKDDNTEEDWLSSTFQVFYDSVSQKVWAGTQAGLASFQFGHRPFRAFSKSTKSQTKLKHLYAVLPVTEQEVIAGDENGLFHINTKSKEIIQIDTAGSNLMIFKGAGDHIFVSNKNGLHILKDRHVMPAYTIFPSLKPLKEDLLGSALQYNDSLVLFASIAQKGLWMWNTRRGQLKTFHQDSARNRIEGLNIITYLYKSKDNRVFILTEKSIIDFNPITEQYRTHLLYHDSTELVNNFMDMNETEHHYWIGTYGNGLVQTDKGFRVSKVITTNSGLSNNCVYRVFIQGSHIIATTNQGLSVVDDRTQTVKAYYKADGLHGDGFEQLCGYHFNNQIYAGGANGFTIIDPEHFYRNSSPAALFLQGIKIETASKVIDTIRFVIDQLTIPNDVLQTTIRFTALNYPSPTRVTYAYKIDELSDEWIDLGTQNFVNLIGLNTGTYSFHVKAANEDGIWSAPLKLELVYLPKWYQTAWFKIIVLLTMALIAYSFLRYRLSHLKKQQQIRREIANDLHDDIGSTLNTLKIFTHLAKKDPFNHHHLSHIEESITNASVGLRDMIWVLDDSQDTVFELMERIKKFALSVCHAHGIHFIGTMDPDSGKPISKTEKRNLLLIAKESINNSIKYSSCKTIEVWLARKKNEVVMTIRDDGNGFHQDKITHGHGLLNMAYRTRQIGYSLDIQSAPGCGTRIEVKKSI